MRPLPPIICFDAESNGIAGLPLCVGAVVLAPDRRVTSIHLSRAPIAGEVTEFVVTHVLPALCGVPETGTYEEMLAGFFAWYAAARAQHPDAIVVADCGFQVDTRLMHLACDDDARFSSSYQGGHPPAAPYPLHELGTLLLACGLDPQARHPELASNANVDIALERWTNIDASLLRPHHPVYDATQSALVANACLERLWKKLP